MALTTSLVQGMLTAATGSGRYQTCVYLGPTPSRVELLSLIRQATDSTAVDAFKVSMIEALALALASRREVRVGHDDSDPFIYSVELR